MSNWDTLHLRFSTTVRDTVSVASTDGDELSVEDRDSYLNYAYEKYIGLVAEYNPEVLNIFLQELLQGDTITPSGGIAALPADFGYFVGLSGGSGVTIRKPSNDEWLKIKSSNLLQNQPSVTYVYIQVIGSVLQVIPATFESPCEILYIKFPQSIVQGGADDLSLKPLHWGSIISFAKAEYYRDKGDFEIAISIENDAILRSPIKIGVVK
jgi:hypothetical protein